MHDFSPLYHPFAPAFLLAFLPIVILAVIWTTILKGFALWHAARGSQKWWFIALLIVNSLGILEIIYLIWFRPTSSSSAPAVSSETQA
jgi:hypothetical protein